MPTKTISIKEEVYRKLKALKRESESFSDLLDRLLDKHTSLAVLKNLRGSVKIEDKEDLLEEIYKRRGEWR